MLAWIDLETTGLDCNTDLILEVACVLTDDQGKTLDNGLFGVTAWYPHLDEVRDKVDPFVRDMHDANGLWTDCLNKGVPLDIVEKSLHAFLRGRVDEDDKPPLCGSTIGFDKNFLRAWMAPVLDHFHYRVIDVSSLKETFRRWGWGDMVDQWKAEHTDDDKKHRALDDIFDSINEWCFYRDTIKSA